MSISKGSVIAFRLVAIKRLIAESDKVIAGVFSQMFAISFLYKHFEIKIIQRELYSDVVILRN